MGAPLVLGAALGLSLALIAVALTPERTMRRSRAISIRGRRDLFFWSGLACALGITLGVGIMLALR
jgi:hypothetical protein